MEGTLELRATCETRGGRWRDCCTLRSSFAVAARGGGGAPVSRRPVQQQPLRWSPGNRREKWGARKRKEKAQSTAAGESHFYKNKTWCRAKHATLSPALSLPSLVKTPN